MEKETINSLTEKFRNMLKQVSEKELLIYWEAMIDIRKCELREK